MHYLTSSALATAFLVSRVVASGLPVICPLPNVQGGGCMRYTKGFDITGVTTEVDLTYPTVRNECDCIQACYDNIETCANYVYKFTTPQSVQSGFRTCTLYSNFNLPANVTVDYNLRSTQNVNINKAAIVSHGNNPQHGSLVPQAFMDMNLDTTPDPNAISGPMWRLANGVYQC